MNLTRPFILLTLSVLTQTSAIFSQDTVYTNYLHIKVFSRDEAAFYTIRSRTDSGLLVSDYTLSGDTVSTELYSVDSPHVRQGVSRWYGDYGTARNWIMFHSCTFRNDKKNGPETWYFRGRLQVTGSNTEDQKEGEWTAYYLSGKLAGKANYSKGKQLSAEFFLEDGRPNRSATVFFRLAKFPGGDSAFLKFLNKTFKYPRAALKHEIQGTVILQIKITTEGKLDSVHVIRSVDKSLDEEALRVIQKSPVWEPAIAGGVPFPAYAKQPIVFKLERQ